MGTQHEDEYERNVAALQAQAMAEVQRDLAEAAKSQDPLWRDKQFFLMLLIEARLARKLSQAELAAAAGMSQSSIARIESGRGNPTLNTLLTIAKVLGGHLVLE